MANTSVIGEKFVFSNFLSPVDEETEARELEEINAWLESDEENVEIDDEVFDDDGNESCKGNEGCCKESAEEKVERLKAELEAAEAELASDEQKKNDDSTDGESVES